MKDELRAEARERGYYSHVSDPRHSSAKRGLNARTAMIPLGEPGDERSPVIGIIWVNEGPGDPLRGHHLHTCDAINLVIEGSICMDGTWLTPGQAKIVPANFTYGDGLPTPGGGILLEIFENHGAKPRYHDAAHMAYYEEVHGQELGLKDG